MSFSKSLILRAEKHADIAAALELTDPEEATVYASQAVHIYKHALIELEEAEEGTRSYVVGKMKESVEVEERLRLLVRLKSINIHQALDSEDLSCHSSQILVPDDFTAKFRQSMKISKGGPGLDTFIGPRKVKTTLKLLRRLFLDQCSEPKSTNCDLQNLNVLLFGLPGTGKTTIVRLYHQGIPNCALIELSPSDLMSKFYGQSEKSLKAALTLASENAPAIVFIDEIEGIFRSRAMNTGSCNASLLSQFLILANNCPGVQIIGATNKPEHLDPALLRRFGSVIHVALPTSLARLYLFDNYIQKDPHCEALTTDELAKLATLTEGYAPSDIEKVVSMSRMQLIAEAAHSEWFKLRQSKAGSLWTPCDPDEEGATNMKLEQIPPEMWDMSRLSFKLLQESIYRCPRVTADDEQGRLAKQALREFLSKCDAKVELEGETALEKMQRFNSENGVDTYQELTIFITEKPVSRGTQTDCECSRCKLDSVI